MLQAHKPIPCELGWLWTSIDFICRRLDRTEFYNFFRDWKEVRKNSHYNLFLQRHSMHCHHQRTNGWQKFSFFLKSNFEHVNWALLSNSCCFLGVLKKKRKKYNLVVRICAAADYMRSKFTRIVRCKQIWLTQAGFCCKLSWKLILFTILIGCTLHAYCI